MIACLTAILAMTAIGIPVVHAIEPQLRLRALIGTSYLAGSGIAALVMFVLGLSGAGWSRATVVPACLAVIGVGWWLSRRPVPSALRVDREREGFAWTIDVLVLLCVAGYAVYATLAPPWEWDFWAIWGLKARHFFEAGGVDFSFLRNADHRHSHPDYPILLPLVYDFVALSGGAWNDRLLGLVNVAYGLAVLLVVRDALGEETGSPVIASIGTIALTGAALSPWVGLAEGPILAYVTAAAVFVRRGLAPGRERSLTIGGLMLGFAAMTKNEGLAFVVAFWVALLVTRRSAAWRVAGLGAAIAAPWLVLRAAFGLSTRMLEGSALDRAMARLAEPRELWAALTRTRPDRVELWVILLVTAALCGAAWMRRERFILTLIVTQLALCLVAYLVTGDDLAWQVGSSMARVTSQVAMLIGFAALLGIAGLIAPRRRASATAAENSEERGDVAS